MLQDQIAQGLQDLSIHYSAAQVEQMQDYLSLLEKWNRSYNLTAITDPSRMVAYHLLDSVAINTAISDNAQCLDVGTGAGLPGIPLAILMPETQWVLLDSNGKKTRFVQQAIASCGLSNVKVVQARIQDYDAASPFDVIVSRAYASLQDFIQSVQKLWQAETRLITMKTELSNTELDAVDSEQYQVEVTPLKVPGIAEKRSLVTVLRKIL